MSVRAVSLDIYRTAIPMRAFEHAAVARDLAEAVVVRLTADDGRVGYGETLPRPYVTGETIESVVSDIRELLWPAMGGMDLSSPVPAEQAGSAPPGPAPFLPESAPDGRCINAAACAVDVALWPWTRGWVVRSLGRDGGKIATRVSGVLGSADPTKTARQLRLMRWYGLRDFKLKLGLGDQTDAENLAVVSRRIGPGLAGGKCTLRVDVNGGWELGEVPARVAALRQFGVCVVEQPARCSAREMVELARRCELPLMADESLLTTQDALTLALEPGRIWWNIRLSKNGGPVRCLRLAQLAERSGVSFVVGCMVGESGILSAAQRRLLELSPRPRFVEGNYGRFLLGDDLVRPSPRFGYGGRLKPIRGAGPDIDPARLRRYGTLLATLRQS